MIFWSDSCRYSLAHVLALIDSYSFELPLIFHRQVLNGQLSVEALVEVRPVGARARVFVEPSSTQL
jgi:hypothetical protein